MSLLSSLKKAVQTRGGKVLVGSAAIGLGTIGTAAAQNSQHGEGSGDDLGETAETGVSSIDVEGEQILVPVDTVLDDPLDDGLAGAEVEAAEDSPVSPDDEVDSPVTVEAAEDSPVSPDDEVDSPATAEAADDSPVTPDATESPDSPATADAADSPVSPESPESP